MAKPQPAVDFEQPDRLRRLKHGAGDPKALSRTPQERPITDRLRRGHQQQPPCVLGQDLQALHEAVLDPTGHRHRAGQPEPSRQLRRRKPPRQFQ